MTKNQKSKQVGLAPGTLIHTGEQKTDKTKITIFDFSPAKCEESVVQTPEETFSYKDRQTKTWINID